MKIKNLQHRKAESGRYVISYTKGGKKLTESVLSSNQLIKRLKDLR